MGTGLAVGRRPGSVHPAGSWPSDWGRLYTILPESRPCRLIPEQLGQRQGETGEDLLVAEGVANLQRLHLPG